MKSGSSTAVITAAESVTYMPRRASPTALSTVDNPMPADIRRLEGRTIQRKLRATGRVWSLAPRKRSTHGRTGRSASDTSVPATAMCRQQEVASRRARSRSPAPSARDTSAPTAIIKPTLMEIVMKRTIVARPTPAVRRGSPSQEM